MSQPEQFNRIVIPVHPDERDVPVSLVHVPISKGRYVTIQGPLAPKTMTAMLATLEANKDSLIEKPNVPENMVE